MSVASASVAMKACSKSFKQIIQGKSLFLKHESRLSPAECVFHWKNPSFVRVGTQSELTLQLVRKNGAAYSIRVQDTFHCTVKASSSGRDIEHSVEPKFLVGQTKIAIKFTAQLPDSYSVEVKINGNIVGGGPARKHYKAGELDITKSKLIDAVKPKIVTANVYFSIQLQAEDSFGNLASILENSLEADIRKNSHDGEQTEHTPVLHKAGNPDSHQYKLCLKLKESGYYFGSIKYNGIPIQPNNFAIICLTERESQSVRINTAIRGRNVLFRAKLVTGDRTEDVHCSITPQTLKVIKNRRFGIIPRRTYTCKVSPMRKIILHAEPQKFTVDNREEEPITLSSRDRNIIAAMFYKFIHQSIGGSQDFEKKKQYCCEQLRIHHHLSSKRENVAIHVKRNDLLKTAIQATKNLSLPDWLKRMEITFDGEIGSDFGGLNREFIELLSKELFGEKSNLFVRLDADSEQSPVHPNHRNTQYKNYELAGKIVGKCLLESLVHENVLLLRTNFTQSFLAKLMGLKVNYSYYEADDPVYFRHKIQYTLENDISDSDLFYTDTAQNVPLRKNGQRKRVTEENKEEYLNDLANFRLAKQPHKQIEHFTKGLTLLIPLDILTIFTEKEFELLICGIDEVMYDDMKRNTHVIGAKNSSAPTLTWFWTIIEQFTQEERKMLLKYVTGSSRLPRGGFSALTPQFTIFMLHEKGRLPTAHTCTSQLDLPEFDSLEQLHAALMTALNEDAQFHHY